MFDSAAMVGLVPRSVTSTDAGALRAALVGVRAVRAALDRYEALLVSASTAAGAAQGGGAAGTAAWLREVTGVSYREAARRVELAEGLAQVPEAADALSSGRLTAEHAGVLARAAHHCPSVADHAAELVAAGAEMGADEFARHLRTWVRDHTPDGGAGEFERQHANRRARSFTTDDGMTVLDVRLDPVAGHEVLTALDRIAEQLWHGNVADARAVPLAVRRADALVEACRRALAADPAATRRPGGLAIVHIDHQTLLGQVAAHPVCHLADATPIAPATARRLACNAGILPVMLDGASQALDVGRTRRLPTRAQRLALLARDGPTCVFPGCDRPAAWGDVHHCVPWEAGGPTNLHNLAHICDPHHHLCHEGGWTLTRGPEGTFTATPPHGTVLRAPAAGRGRGPVAPQRLAMSA